MPVQSVPLGPKVGHTKNGSASLNDEEHRLMTVHSMCANSSHDVFNVMYTVTRISLWVIVESNLSGHSSCI